MTARHEPPPNPLAVAAWVAGTIVALAAVMFIPEWAWPWLLALAIGAGPWFACSRLLDRIAELEGEVARNEREVIRELGVSPVRVSGRARSVPTQRTTNDNVWDAIKRATEGEA